MTDDQLTVKIMVADDHKLMREALCRMLEERPGFTVVAQADDGRHAVELARKHRPDLVLVDVAMPGLNGVEATRRLLEENSNTRVIALTMYTDRQMVERMMEAGATGYLTKDCAFDLLEQAVKVVMEGKLYLSPRVAQAVNMEPPPQEAPPEPPRLTPRQREVLQLYAEGHSTRQIAEKLGLSIKTVETHRSHIMEKLSLKTIAELTRYAIRAGITSLDI